MRIQSLCVCFMRVQSLCSVHSVFSKKVLLFLCKIKEGDKMVLFVLYVFVFYFILILSKHLSCSHVVCHKPAFLHMYLSASGIKCFISFQTKGKKPNLLWCVEVLNEIVFWKLICLVCFFFSWVTMTSICELFGQCHSCLLYTSRCV